MIACACLLDFDQWRKIVYIISRLWSRCFSTAYMGMGTQPECTERENHRYDWTDRSIELKEVHGTINTLDLFEWTSQAGKQDRLDFAPGFGPHQHADALQMCAGGLSWDIKILNLWYGIACCCYGLCDGWHSFEVLTSNCFKTTSWARASKNY